MSAQYIAEQTKISIRSQEVCNILAIILSFVPLGERTKPSTVRGSLVSDGRDSAAALAIVT
jgi:hypothetical protein